MRMTVRHEFRTSVVTLRSKRHQFESLIHRGHREQLFSWQGKDFFVGQSSGELLCDSETICSCTGVTWKGFKTRIGFLANDDSVLHWSSDGCARFRIERSHNGCSKLVACRYPRINPIYCFAANNQHLIPLLLFMELKRYQNSD